VFKKLCPNHHLHDLRHTYATRCAECGVAVNVCQQVLGHATADMTLNVYMHVLDEFKRKELEKFTLFPKY
jgi:integrase